MIVIQIPGEPMAQGRARAFMLKTPNGPQIRMYDPKKSRNWKATAQHHMQEQLHGLPPLAGPVRLQVIAVFTCPKSAWRKRDPVPATWHAKKPDGDNVVKAVKDAAKGVLWIDDAQVAITEIIKLVGAQGRPPEIRLIVEELTTPPRLDWYNSATRTPDPAPEHTPAPQNASLFR